MSGESTEIFHNYTIQAKIKANSTQFARTTACQFLTEYLNNCTQQRLCKHCIWITKKKIYQHKELNLGCRATIINSANNNLYSICFVVCGSQVIIKCYKFCSITLKSLQRLVVNNCEMSSTKIEESNSLKKNFNITRGAGCSCLLSHFTSRAALFRSV